MQRRKFGSNPTSVLDTDCVGPGDVYDGAGAAVTGTVDEGEGTVVGTDAGADEDAGAGAGVGDPITVMFEVTVLHPKFSKKSVISPCGNATCLIQLPMFIGHPNLSGMWLGVAPRTELKQTVFEEIELSAQNIMTSLGSGMIYITT